MYKGQGYAIQMSIGHLCMNNTTVTNNSGRDGTINGAGSMLIVNSTIIEDGAQNSGAVIRCESWPARQSFLMNNIILNKNAANPVVEMSGCFSGLPFSGICFSMTLNACLSC